MKGRITEVLPFVFMAIIGVVLAINGFIINGSFTEEVKDTYDGMSRMVETRSLGEMYFYNYLPAAASYSVQQASYELGKSGGGEGVDWHDTNLGTSSYTGVAKEVYGNLSGESKEYLNEEYVGRQQTRRCDISDSEYELITATEFDKGIDITLFSQDPIRITCNFEGGDTSYKGGKEFFRASPEASDNRFHLLVRDTISFFKDLRNQWNGIGQSFSGSGSSCGSASIAEESAEDSANSSATKAIEDIFKSVKNSYTPSRESFKVLSSSVKPIVTVTEATATATGDCNCRTVDGNTVCDTSYSATTTASPLYANVTFAIKDTKFRIPVEEGQKKLVFKVENYRDDLDN